MIGKIEYLQRQFNEKALLSERLVRQAESLQQRSFLRVRQRGRNPESFVVSRM
jgi:hypothetical protein